MKIKHLPTGGEIRYSAIPVIILTAPSSKADEIRSFELGCDFFMNKPIRIADFLQLATVVKKFAAY